MPFKMNAESDLGFLQQGILDMLTSRLSWEKKVLIVPRRDTLDALKDAPVPMNEEAARAIGTRLQATHVLFGSLTMFGNSASLDGTLVDVHQKGPTLTFFKQTNTIDEVIPQVDLFATEIQEKVFGRAVAVSRPVAPPQETPSIYAHPDNLLGQEADQEAVAAVRPAPAATGGFVQPTAVAEGGMPMADFWKSQKFEDGVKGLALGDVDGDGRTEVVFVSDRRVYVYRFQGGRLLRVWEMDGRTNQEFVGVDVADVNGNGRAEIFVTSVKMPAQVPDSFVVEWDGGSFRTVSEASAWYYRVVNIPDRGPVLFGQKGRREDVFVRGVYELAWRNGEYAPDERLTLPKGVNLYGFALGDVMNNGEHMVAAYDDEDHILLYNRSGEEQWRSDNQYGGSLNYLESSAHGGTADDLMDRLYLPQRIFIRDMDGDGQNEVIVSSNQGALGRLLAHYRKFSRGHIESLSWTHLGLTPSSQTRELSGHISDYDIGDFDHDGRDEVIVAQVDAEGRILKRTRSYIIGYEAPRPLPTQ
jgi:TolB-like protein